MWKMSHKLLDVDFKPEVQLHREEIWGMKRLVPQDLQSQYTKDPSDYWQFEGGFFFICYVALSLLSSLTFCEEKRESSTLQKSGNPMRLEVSDNFDQGIRP